MEAELMAGTCTAPNGTSSLVFIDEAAEENRKNPTILKFANLCYAHI